MKVPGKFIFTGANDFEKSHRGNKHNSEMCKGSRGGARVERKSGVRESERGAGYFDVSILAVHLCTTMIMEAVTQGGR